MKNTQPIPFVPLLRSEEVKVYYSRGLPHWRQTGSTYFVTFRTADSMPSGFRDEFLASRDDWLRDNGFDPGNDDWKETIRDAPEDLAEGYEFWCVEEMNQLLDRGAGACVLKRRVLAEVVEEALKFYDPQRFRLGGFVVMPNHVHLLATPTESWELEALIRSIKGYSAKVINGKLGGTGAFWQAGFYDRLVRTSDELRRFQKYIRDNPAKAGLDPKSYISREAVYEF